MELEIPFFLKGGILKCDGNKKSPIAVTPIPLEIVRISAGPCLRIVGRSPQGNPRHLCPDCPGQWTRQQFPELVSPFLDIWQLLKTASKNGKNVFVGPWNLKRFTYATLTMFISLVTRIPIRFMRKIHTGSFEKPQYFRISARGVHRPSSLVHAHIRLLLIALSKFGDALN